MFKKNPFAINCTDQFQLIVLAGNRFESTAFINTKIPSTFHRGKNACYPRFTHAADVAQDEQLLGKNINCPVLLTTIILQ